MGRKAQFASRDSRATGLAAPPGRRRIARLTGHITWILVLLIAFVFASTLAPAAQEQHNVWIRQFGTSAHDFALGIAADASGVYVAGVTSDTLPGQTSSGSMDAFVRKYDVLGTELWTHQFGTSLHDEARGIAVDASGIYVAGYTGATLPHLSGAEAFVRKYDDSGTEVWTRQFEASNSDIARAISVDASGIYVAGFASGAGWDGFVRKYDADGSQAWTRQFGTSSHDRAEAISVDASGVYVAGGTHGTLPGQTSLGPGDAFVRKYDASGTEVWTRQFGTALSESAYAIAADSSGIYVAGGGSGGEFFRKYDVDGTEVWTRDDSAAAISIDGSGVYVAAGGSVRKYDEAGTVLWTHPFADASGNSTWAISVDASEIYVAGATLGTLSGETSMGGRDAFVIRLPSERREFRIDAD